jgi:hypothetical protein
MVMNLPSNANLRDLSSHRGSNIEDMVKQCLGMLQGQVPISNAYASSLDH